jgi:hypothetical protein
MHMPLRHTENKNVSFPYQESNHNALVAQPQAYTKYVLLVGTYDHTIP